MEHLSLEYFVEIAKQRNISKAAENLHMSQQSLSAYIQKLEKYYGVQLLIRKPKMRLTEAGERVLLAAEQINEIYIDMEKDLKALRVSDELQISLGIFLPVVNRVMQKLPLVEISKAYPNTSIRVATDYNTPLHDRVVKGEMDFAIIAVRTPTSQMIIDPSLEKKFLGMDEECVIMSDQVLRLYFADEYEKYLGEIFSGGGGRSIGVAHIPMVMHPMNTGISQLIKQYYIENHCTFKLFGEGATQEIVNSIVVNNNAMGFCSRHYAQDLIQKADRVMHAFPLKSPELKRDIFLVYRKDLVKENKKKQKFSEIMGIVDLIVDAWKGKKEILEIQDEWKE